MAANMLRRAQQTGLNRAKKDAALCRQLEALFRIQQSRNGAYIKQRQTTASDLYRTASVAAYAFPVVFQKIRGRYRSLDGQPFAALWQIVSHW